MLSTHRFERPSFPTALLVPLLALACTEPQSDSAASGHTNQTPPGSLGDGAATSGVEDGATSGGSASVDANTPGGDGMGGASGTAQATCEHQPPLQPGIVAPLSGAEGISRTAVTLQSSEFADTDLHTLAAVEWEIRENDGSSDPPLAWSGTSTTPQLDLSAGTFATSGDTALKFGQDYILRVRHQDSAPCNNLSEWSLPVAFTTDDGGDVLFDQSVVRRIDINIPTDNGSPSSWESIEAEAEADACENVIRNYYEGSVQFEGATYAGVGLRAKGGCGSSRSLADKASFKVNLSWDSNPADDFCPPSRRIYGKQRITLNAGVQDDTAMHEHLTFQMYRAAGVPAPRTASIQVYVNGEYYGLYQNIEAIDRSFLDQWFDSSQGKGMMYEGAYRCDFFGGNDDPMEDGHCWEREFELDSCDSEPSAGDDLQHFEADGVTPHDPWALAQQLESSLDSIRDSASFFPAVQTLIDWDRFLAYWAVSAVIIDWDNYVYNRNNFRFYHDVPSGLWVFIPWGVDQTWRPRGGGRRNPFGLFNPVADIPNLCLEASGSDDTGTCTDRYAQAVLNVLEAFESVDWLAEIDTWQARLDPYMQLEGDRKTYDYDEWLEAIAELREFATTRAGQVRTELDDESNEEAL